MSTGLYDDDDDELETNLDDGDGDGDGDEGQDQDGEDEDRGDEVTDGGDDDDESGDDDGDIEELAKSVGQGGDDEEDEGAAPPKTIPYARFREVNERSQQEREARIRAEERAKILEEQLRGKAAEPAKQETKAQVNLDALEDQYQDAVLEGDKEKAREIRAQIRAEEHRLAEAAAAAIVEKREAERAQKEAVARLNDAAKEMVGKYPFLDHTKPEKNDEAIADVRDLRDAYIAKGMSWDEALRKAADKIGKIYAPKPKSGDGGKTEVTTSRKAESVKRNAQAAAKIPPMSSGGAGKDADFDPEKATAEEIADLPEERRRRLRGDYVG